MVTEATLPGPMGSPNPHADDLRLAQAAATRDAAAARELLGRVLDRVRATIRYVSGDDRDQDDMVQLALVEILRSAGAYKGIGALSAWVDRIAVRTALKQLARRRRRERVVALEDGTDAPPPESWAADEEHARLAMRRRLAHHLGALTAERRAVVTLRMVHGYGIDDIAEMTGAPRNTVRDRLAHGRRELERRLTRDPVFRHWVESGRR
ncbi:MAG: RNA polymerase sigma factor [Deltaproteobacteria bacterium]|nr:RNA polymerase sigma factor [Deltaproteobacteria bacterium]